MSRRIEFQPTPNPNAGKFVVGRTLTAPGTSRSWFSEEDAAADPLARDLMALPGVRSIFMVGDFVTVSKTDTADWADLVPRVTAVLETRT